VRTDVPPPHPGDGVGTAGAPPPRAAPARELDALGGVGALLRFGGPTGASA